MYAFRAILTHTFRAIFGSCVSWNFIGTSSPAVTVEGARRSTLITSQAAWPAVAAGFGF
jgi:hypothetical protein